MKPIIARFVAHIVHDSSLQPAPQLEVLENTLGDVESVYVSPGEYQLKLPNGFPVGKTRRHVVNEDEGSIQCQTFSTHMDDSTIRISVRDRTANAGTDDSLSGFVEITVYP